jgi:hypothetical protein
MTFFACMALAAAALAVSSIRSNEPAGAPAKPEAPLRVHFKWSVRGITDPLPVDALPVSASVPATAVESVVRRAGLPRRAAGLATARRARRVPRVYCPRPGTLSFDRYEDGSATLSCAGRVLVRVSVPG